jgi:hypothetical protein
MFATAASARVGSDAQASDSDNPARVGLSVREHISAQANPGEPFRQRVLRLSPAG